MGSLGLQGDLPNCESLGLFQLLLSHLYGSVWLLELQQLHPYLREHKIWTGEGLTL